MEEDFSNLKEGVASRPSLCEKLDYGDGDEIMSRLLKDSKVTPGSVLGSLVKRFCSNQSREDNMSGADCHCHQGK